MLITYVTLEALQYALAKANEHFEGNIQFRECEKVRTRKRDGGEVWKVNLKIRASAERIECREKENGHCNGLRSDTAHYTKAECKAKCDSRHCGHDGGEGVTVKHRCKVQWKKAHHRYSPTVNHAGCSRREHHYGRGGNGGEKYLSYACWHAHGLFFDALPANAKLETKMYRGRVDEYGWRNESGPNIGSQMYPVYAAEACDCDGNPPRVERFTTVAVRAAKKLTRDTGGSNGPYPHEAAKP